MLPLGLRRSEACGLRWSDVNLDERAIRVAQGVHRVNRLLDLYQQKPGDQTGPFPYQTSALEP
jgi:integrase